MKFISSLKIAYKSLLSHKLRSFLTILGIVIGITSVIIVFSAGEGIKGILLGQIESFGSNFIEVEVKTPSTSKTSMENATSLVMGVSITTLAEEDAEAVKKHPNINNVYSAIIGQAMVTKGQESSMKQLWGVSSSFIDIDTSEVEVGRFFTEEEDKGLAKVTVIGQKIKEDYFGQQDPLGKFLKVGKNNYKVIGVLEEKGSMMSLDMDDMLYIPLNTVQQLIMGINHVSFIIGEMKNQELSQNTADDLTLLMRERHNITNPEKDDFSVTTMQEMMQIFDTIFNAITLLLMAIVTVSLIVGGVGIMNIMFVSITERTSEIGLRKAVGASSKRILSQFLWEAVVLTSIGGIFGIIIGILFSLLTAVGAQSQGLDWPFIIRPISLVISVSVSVGIGLIFGLYPAQKAANMDPIEAMRFEG